MNVSVRITLLRAVASVFAVLSIPLAANAQRTGATSAPQRSEQALASPSAMPGVVIVKFRDGVSPRSGAAKSGAASLSAVESRFNVSRVERALPFIESAASKREISREMLDLRQVYRIHYSGPWAPDVVAKAFANDPNVVYAEPSFIQKLAGSTPQAIPNDPLYGNMSHLVQTVFPAAWDVVKAEQGSVIIAIVDGGTDYNHPDLLPNVWTNTGETPGNSVDDDNNGFVDDIHGWNFANDTADPTGLAATPGNAKHGTNSAGVAAAVSDNGIGIAGSSWNATMMPINAGCPTLDNLICYGYQGIAYAAANGADIVNASWGGDDVSSFARDVVDAAASMGTLVVAAAGNDSRDLDALPQYPANFDAVLSVGATNKSTDNLASFTNYGRSVDVFAPGVSLDVTNPGTSYGTSSGTSFSSPLVAGLAALVKTAFPSMTIDELRAQIRSTADNIAAQNPGRSGKLGKGRVNALAAVTTTNVPAVRVTDISFTDTDADGTIESGETIQLTVTFTNLLAAVSNLSVDLSAEDAFATVTQGSATIPSLAKGASSAVTFTMDVAASTPRGTQLLLDIDLSSGTYSDVDLIRLLANPTRLADQTSPTVEVSVTDEGNIGCVEFCGDPNAIDGFGFQFQSKNLLFEGGLLLATDNTHVSDAVRGLRGDASNQNADFAPDPVVPLQLLIPGEITAQQTKVQLSDATAVNPIGISILQESFIDDAAANQDFITFRYTLTNDNATAVTGLYAGLFFDWDISTDAVDDAAIDIPRRFGYAADDLAEPTVFVGTKVLSKEWAYNYRAIDNPVEFEFSSSDATAGFSESEKYNFMSGGIEVASLSGTDISQLSSAGPLDLDAGASVTVGFAIVAGSTLNELLDNADAAQELWDKAIDPNATAVDPELPIGTLVLDPVYPNPTSFPVSIRYELAVAGDASLTVYDVLGREVTRLASGVQAGGEHKLAWDGADAAGRRVANGLYFARLVVRSGKASETATQAITVVD